MASESKRPDRPTPQGAFGGSTSPNRTPDGSGAAPLPTKRRSPEPPRSTINGLGFGGPAQAEREAAAATETPEEFDPEADIFAEEQDTGQLLAAETRRPPPPTGLGALSFPPTEAMPAADEVVLDEIAANATERTPSSQPPPLGYAEGHDAWTVERMSRQSTVPPQADEDFSRLRELSARRISELPPEDTRGGALDLVDHSRPSEQLDLLGEMEELYALDDLTGALRFAELILGREPGNLQAQRCADNCRARLIRLYSSKLGDMDQPVTLALEDAELRWLGLDHRSGFLLSRVDGMSTVEELLDICGMPRLEGLKTLVELLERGAIRVGPR